MSVVDIAAGAAAGMSRGRFALGVVPFGFGSMMGVTAGGGDGAGDIAKAKLAQSPSGASGLVAFPKGVVDLAPTTIAGALRVRPKEGVCV